MSTKLTVSLCVGVVFLVAVYLTAIARDRPIIQPVYPAPIYEARAENTNVRVAILKDGAATVVYRDGPYRWIEGRRGERFAFRITNDNPYPVGVILSADGQSLTADGRARSEHPAYLVYSYQSVTIGIWREDLGGGRELVFTDVDQSLAARKGDRRNIGVLGALIWQLEDSYPPVPMERPGDARESAKSGESADAPSADAARPEHDHGIGVGAGQRVPDRAYITDRYRRVRVLDTVSLYYDDRAGLVRAGVDLNQYQHPYPAPYLYPQPKDRRDSEPFPEGDYRGVRIPD